MSDQNSAKLKALQLTLDKLDKTYGKGAVMKLGDEVIEEVESITNDINNDDTLNASDKETLLGELEIKSSSLTSTFPNNQSNSPIPF